MFPRFLWFLVLMFGAFLYALMAIIAYIKRPYSRTKLILYFIIFLIVWLLIYFLIPYNSPYI